MFWRSLLPTFFFYSRIGSVVLLTVFGVLYTIFEGDKCWYEEQLVFFFTVTAKYVFFVVFVLHRSLLCRFGHLNDLNSTSMRYSGSCEVRDAQSVQYILSTFTFLICRTIINNNLMLFCSRASIEHGSTLTFYSIFMCGVRKCSAAYSVLISLSLSITRFWLTLMRRLCPPTTS